MKKSSSKDGKVKFDFESNMRRLDEIIACIEESETPLADSLALYKEGMALAADCAQNLAAVEKEVFILTKEASGIVKQRAFDADGDDND